MGWGCDGMTHRCLQGPRVLAQTGQRLCAVTQGCAGGTPAHGGGISEKQLTSADKWPRDIGRHAGP